MWKAVAVAAVAAAVAVTGCAGEQGDHSASLPSGSVSPAATAARPLALVYRGPAGCEGCSEPVARLLRTSPLHFRVRYIGPREQLKLRPSSFAGVSLYAQPGGDTSVARASRALGPIGRRAIVAFVRGGGRYLGFCQGAYLAGSDPGMGMLRPGDTVQYIATRGASTRTVADTVIPIQWGDRTVDVYFQDGPAILPGAMPGERILARYANGRVAALVRPFGAGRLGVVGPHPEAPASWYREAGLRNRDRDGLDTALGDQLIRATMASS